jgi:hypothetical protein
MCERERAQWGQHGHNVVAGLVELCSELLAKTLLPLLLLLLLLL